MMSWRLLLCLLRGRKVPPVRCTCPGFQGLRYALRRFLTLGLLSGLVWKVPVAQTRKPRAADVKQCPCREVATPVSLARDARREPSIARSCPLTAVLGPAPPHTHTQMTVLGFKVASGRPRGLEFLTSVAGGLDYYHLSARWTGRRACFLLSSASSVLLSSSGVPQLSSLLHPMRSNL